MQGLATVRREPDPPQVIRSIVQNLRSFWTLRAEPPPAENPGIVWWTSGGLRRPLNGVLALETADPGPAADRLAATFRLSGLPCAWLEGPDPSSPDLGLRLLGLGYRTLEGSHGFALPLREARQTLPNPPGFLLQHGHDPELLGALGFLVGEGSLHLGAEEIAPLQALLRPRVEAQQAEEEIWVALSDGEPVAGLLTHRAERTVGLYALATRPERRGEGFASALVLAAARAAWSEGAELAVAEASEVHAAPLRRLGFRDYCDFRRYGWEPHPAPPDGV